MSRIPRTFAFDKNIPQDDYDQYIDPDDLLNESFEKVKGDFEFYRKKRATEIIREEQIEKNEHLKPKRKPVVSDHQIQKRIKLPQNQVISELDSVNAMVSKTREKIRFLEYQCDKMKKRVQQPDFGLNHQTTKNTIQKTSLIKENVFNENDFQKLIQQEEDEELVGRQEQKKQKPQKGFLLRVKSNTKLDPRTNKSHKIIRNAFKFDKQSSFQGGRDSSQSKGKEGKEEIAPPVEDDVKQQQDVKEVIKRNLLRKKQQQAQDKASNAIEGLRALQRTCESFGVYSQSVIDFRMQTLKEAKLRRLFQETQEIDQQVKEHHDIEVQDMKNNNMHVYLLNVMSKPALDKKMNLIKDLAFHQRRIKDMVKNTNHTIKR